MEMNRFFAVGVSYKTADIDLRGCFNLNDSQLHALFLEAKSLDIKDDGFIQFWLNYIGQIGTTKKRGENHQKVSYEFSRVKQKQK